MPLDGVTALALSKKLSACPRRNGQAVVLREGGRRERSIFMLNRLRDLKPCRSADGGSDTVPNAVALCPNRHRQLHHEVNAPTLVDALYRKDYPAGP